MDWWKASTASVIAQAVRMLSGLVIIKLIAVSLGPEGFGRLGHFMSLIAILSVLAGGGIMNGIVKYVSEYKKNENKLYPFLSNTLAYSLIFSLLVFFIILLFSKRISVLLFNEEKSANLIVFLSLIQFTYGLLSFCNGTINGLKETTKFAKIIILGTLIGLPISYYFIHYYGFGGAVIGLAVVNTSLLFPAMYEIYKLGFFKKINIKFNWPDTKKISKFSLMQIFSLATLPLAEIYIRSLILHDAGLHEAGLWQSLMRLSSVYVGFFTTFLAAYYLPTLSSMLDKDEIFDYVIKYIVAIGGIFIFIAIVVYNLRTFVFSVIFSKEFIIPSKYVLFQLMGDFFKIMSYVIGFFVVAKAKTVLYILAELAQSSLYLGVAVILIKFNDVLEVFPAYAISNFLYFLICVVGLLLYKRNINKVESLFR